jgi:predicted transcriptional regulator
MKQIQELFNQGLTKVEIAKHLGLGYSTVRKYLAGQPTPRSCTIRVCKCGESNQRNFYKCVGNICKKCHNRYTYDRQKDKVKAYMDERGGAHCMRCGYSKYIGALEFHHRDPSQKDPDWNVRWCIARLRKELDKCDIVCANCHREIHAEMRNDQKA